MSISNDEKIDLDQIVSEFKQLVSDDSQNLSTDPNIVRVKVIRPDENNG